MWDRWSSWSSSWIVNGGPSERQPILALPMTMLMMMHYWFRQWRTWQSKVNCSWVALSSYGLLLTTGQSWLRKKVQFFLLSTWQFQLVTQTLPYPGFPLSSHTPACPSSHNGSPTGPTGACSHATTTAIPRHDTSTNVATHTCCHSSTTISSCGPTHNWDSFPPQPQPTPTVLQLAVSTAKLLAPAICSAQSCVEYRCTIIIIHIYVKECPDDVKCTCKIKIQSCQQRVSSKV